MYRLRLILCLSIWVWIPCTVWAQDSLQTLERQILNVFANKRFAAYPYATERYLDFLRAIPKAESDQERQVMRQHLLYMAMVMEPDDPARTVLDGLLEGHENEVEPLIVWWHRQDPLHHSETNERLQEHLARIAYAREHYAYPKDARGVDDRGEIYIRLGAPLRDKQIKIVSAGVWLNPYSARLPDNDFWEYRQIDKEAHYLFIRTSRNRPYKISTAEDLIPRDLVSSRRRAGLLLSVMEEVFAQLALAHPHYGSTYDALNNYLNIPGYSGANAYQFARRVLDKARLDDDLYDRNRDYIIPASFTNALRGADPLTVATRWARFLEPDGRTRVELYWGISSSALAPGRRLVRRLERAGHTSQSRYLISFSVALRDKDFVTQSIDTRHFSLPASQNSSVRAQSWSTTSAAPLPHLAMQWEQRWSQYEEGNEGISAGATLKIGTQTLDSLSALTPDPSHLEMSDIRPMLASDSSGEATTLYPFETLSLSTPIALYFEVYHLTFDTDDQTRYFVEYRIEGLDDPQRRPLAVGSEYRSSTRTAQQHIGLDLSTWNVPGPISIVVHVTDTISGQSSERSIQFDYAL